MAHALGRAIARSCEVIHTCKGHEVYGRIWVQGRDTWSLDSPTARQGFCNFSHMDPELFYEMVETRGQFHEASLR